MSKILWLASFPKSGNTWLRAFLANYICNDRLPVDINRLPALALGDMRSCYYEKASGKNAAALDWAEINRLRPTVHRLLAEAGPGIVPVKTHTILTVIDGIPTITPEVTFGAIYIVRNPLDVVVSFSHHYGMTLDSGVKSLCLKELEILPKEGAIRQLLSDWSSHVQSWRTAPGLYLKLIRYEDMIASPQKVFSGIIEFLKLPKDRERLQRAIRHSSFRVLSAQEEAGGFVERSKNAEKFFRRGVAGQWKKELSREQVEKIITHHRSTMTELGYLSAEGKIIV